MRSSVTLVTCFSNLRFRFLRFGTMASEYVTDDFGLDTSAQNRSTGKRSLGILRLGADPRDLSFDSSRWRLSLGTFSKHVNREQVNGMTFAR